MNKQSTFVLDDKWDVSESANRLRDYICTQNNHGVFEQLSNEYKELSIKVSVCGLAGVGKSCTLLHLTGARTDLLNVKHVETSEWNDG